MKGINACKVYGGEYNIMAVREREKGSYKDCPAYDRWKKLRNDTKPRYVKWKEPKVK
jgi:hypothetical protein